MFMVRPVWLSWMNKSDKYLSVYMLLRFLTFILSISEQIWTKSPTEKWWPLSNPTTPFGDKLFPASDSPTGPDTFVNTAGLNVHLNTQYYRTLLNMYSIYESKEIAVLIWARQKCLITTIRNILNTPEEIPVSGGIGYYYVMIFVYSYNCSCLSETFKHSICPSSMTLYEN